MRSKKKHLKGRKSFVYNSTSLMANRVIDTFGVKQQKDNLRAFLSSLTSVWPVSR